MSDPMIRIEDLHKQFDDLKVLNGVDAEIQKGEVISIIGPSGCGKSTMLRCLNLLEQPSSGRIIIDGEEITAVGADAPRIRRRMNMVFQSFNLFDHLTVLENLTIGPVQLLGKSDQEAREKALELLHTVGLAERANHLPSELSGGQKQRVAIARCVAMDPEVILLDEPTSALDPTMVSEVLAVIRNLARQGLTMLMVTHEMEFARDASNRIFFMHEGRIHEQGPPDQVFDHPQSPLTRAFIQRVRSHVISISSADVDIFAIHGGLERFCEKHLITRDVALRLDLATEELIALLLPGLDSLGQFELRAEYSETDRSLVLSVSLPKTFANPLDGTDIESELNRQVLAQAGGEVDVVQQEAHYDIRVTIRQQASA
jgi:polar amino acid transport system ATP-binding protein